MDPIEAEVRALVRSHRQSNRVSRAARRAMRAGLLPEVRAALARHAPTSVLPRYRPGRVDKLLAELRTLARGGFGEIRRVIVADLAAIGVDQSAWAVALLESSVAGNATVSGPVGRAAVREALANESIDGFTLAEWTTAAERSFVERATREIRRGVESGATTGAITRSITGGVAQGTRRHLDAIARTATTFTASWAHMQTYKANSDVLEGVEFVATLDSRTTVICARWDGTVWPVDSPDIQRPPLHVNCRSILSPVVDWKGLGLKAPTRGTRASEDGPTSAQTYERWFRRQPAARQNAIIGPTRGKLFRSGKISFRDMVTRDNRVATIEQLTR